MLPRLTVMSSPVLPGVPLSSTTVTLVRVMLPQLVTVPVMTILVRPAAAGAGQFLVTPIQRVMIFEQVSLQVLVTVAFVVRSGSVPRTKIVSVTGLQIFGFA